MNKTGIYFTAAALFCLSTVACFAQASTAGQQSGPAAASAQQGFDPHDLSGVWALGKDAPRASLLFRSSEPEPSLTDWGNAHLYAGGITHGPHPAPSGHFPGENCNPVAAPAQYAYLRFYPFELVQKSDRVIQLFELHREWREIFMRADHSSDVSPTYMGDSVAHWEGDTLVVDTIGYNGKDFVTEDVDHPMSNQFHLIERFTRLDHDTLKLDLTFMDPKNWGDKQWGGFTRTLKLQSDPLQEWLCVPSLDAEFNEKIMKPTYGSQHLELPNGDSSSPK